jgi:hypothetical protein
MFTYTLLRATGLSRHDATATLARLRALTADEMGDRRLAWAEDFCAAVGWA